MAQKIFRCGSKQFFSSDECQKYNHVDISPYSKNAWLWFCHNLPELLMLCTNAQRISVLTISIKITIDNTIASCLLILHADSSLFMLSAYSLCLASVFMSCLMLFFMFADASASDNNKQWLLVSAVCFCCMTDSKISSMFSAARATEKLCAQHAASS